MQGQRGESEERRGDDDTADQRHSAAIPVRSPRAAGCDVVQHQRVLQQRGGSVSRHHVDPEQHHRGRCVSSVGHSGCFHSFYLFYFFFCFESLYLPYCAKRFPLQVAVCKNRNVRKSQLHSQHVVTKMSYPLDLRIFSPWKVTWETLKKHFRGGAPLNFLPSLTIGDCLAGWFPLCSEVGAHQTVKKDFDGSPLCVTL